jgi:hypothetical protein
VEPTAATRSAGRSTDEACDARSRRTRTRRQQCKGETARARRTAGAAAKRDGAAERLIARLERFLEGGEAEVPAAFATRLEELAAAAAERRAA